MPVDVGQENDIEQKSSKRKFQLKRYKSIIANMGKALNKKNKLLYV